MVISQSAYQQLVKALKETNVTLVAVSKIQPLASIQALYDYGQRDFGENYVQELVNKQAHLPKDIHWHFIGHLQSNKVKYIAPFVHLIHGVDSLKLLKEIDKQGKNNNRVINVLLQVHIAQEESKFGMNEQELDEALRACKEQNLSNVSVNGLMAMASFSDNSEQVNNEFKIVKMLYDKYKLQNPSFSILSMGMSGDYQIAVALGSNMVRIGSLLFGARQAKL
jgi:pyridoxal phosphate enzyme (YggS family)